MKIIFKMFIAKMMAYRLIILSTLLLTGCTHNLIISDYKNEESYYKTLNQISENRKVRIAAKDSCFELENIVADADSVKGKFFRQDPSPFSFFSFSPTIESQVSIPVKDVKSISVTKRTHGILRGIGIGFLTGFFWGASFLDLGGDSNSGHHTDFFSGGVIIGVAGALFGGIIGTIIGDDYVFSFDNRLIRGELYKNNSVHKLGLKLGRHSGYTLDNEPQGGHGGNAGIISTGNPGISITLFYNYVFGKNLSLNNELSYTSAGSDENLFVNKGNRDYTFTRVVGSIVENVKLIEAAPLIRLNLFKEGFTPYFLAGPKFSLQFPPGNLVKEKFYSDVNNQYGGSDFSISGKYQRFAWGLVIGAGLSTGKLFPYEILMEIRYSRDMSSRFKVKSYALAPFDFNLTSLNIGHVAEELVINIGVGIF